MIELTVCVIGRNQKDLLKALRDSLDPLYNFTQVETIYVDSCSDDDSIEVAKNLFDRVVQVGCHSYFSASAGRYVGTLLARGRWILYLDGDMILHPHFVGTVKNVVKGIINGDGVVGLTVDVHIDTGKIIRETKPIETSIFPWIHGASFFGGALLIRRLCVINAGNWTPWLFSFEERELLSRLRRIGCKIVPVLDPMVFHRTKPLSKFRTILNVFLPTTPKYYGLGQIILRGSFEKIIFEYIMVYPDIFALWCIFFLLVLIVKDIWFSFLAFLVIVYILNIFKRLKISTVFLCVSLPVKLLFSLIFAKRVLFIPRIPEYKIIKTIKNCDNS